MSDFHKKVSAIQVNLEVPKGQFNAFGKYKYRSCEDILSALKPHLKEHGLYLTINDEIVLIGERYYNKATCRLTDGDQWVEASAFAREDDSKKGMDAAQLSGATSSYSRKYALSALFGIDDEKDADSTNDHGKGKQVSAPTLLCGKNKGKLVSDMTNDELKGALNWIDGLDQPPSGMLDTDFKNMKAEHKGRGL